MCLMSFHIISEGWYLMIGYKTMGLYFSSPYLENQKIKLKTIQPTFEQIHTYFHHCVTWRTSSTRPDMNHQDGVYAILGCYCTAAVWCAENRCLR